MTATTPEKVSVLAGTPLYGGRQEIGALVADALTRLGLPESFIGPGDRVVLKPNWVKEHDERKPGPGQWEHVVTHPSVIEGVIRWVAPQLKGQGSITICDAPQTDSSFATLRKYCQLDEMVARCAKDFPGVKIALLDLRPEEWHAVDGVTVSKTVLPGDPLGSSHVKLNEASEFVGFHGCGQLYGASYDMAETNRKHAGITHEYMLCRTPMDADVLINIPKLKTHKKVGLTCALNAERPESKFLSVGSWVSETCQTGTKCESAEMVRVKCETVSSLMKKYGHTHVDLLKIDIEGAEYGVLEAIMESGVQIRQIAVEFHNGVLPGIPRKLTIRTLIKLYRYGYRIVHKGGSNHTLCLASEL